MSNQTYLNYTSFINADGAVNILDFIQAIHRSNLNNSTFDLRHFPNYAGNKGTWGFTTDDKELWDSVVAKCAYYREIELEPAQ